MAYTSVRKCLTTGGAVAASSIVTVGLVVATPDADRAGSDVRSVRLAAATCPTATPWHALLQRLTDDQPELVVPVANVVPREAGVTYAAASPKEVLSAFAESTADTTTSRSVANGPAAVTAIPPILEPVVGRILGVALGVFFFGVLIPAAFLSSLVYRALDFIRGLVPIPLAAAGSAITVAEPEPIAAPSLKSEPPASDFVAADVTAAEPSTSDSDVSDEAAKSDQEEPKARPSTRRPVIRDALAFGERLRGLVHRGAKTDDSETRTEAADDQVPQAGEPSSVPSSTGEPSDGGSTGSDDASGASDGGASE